MTVKLSNMFTAYYTGRRLGIYDMSKHKGWDLVLRKVQKEEGLYKFDLRYKINKDFMQTYDKQSR